MIAKALACGAVGVDLDTALTAASCAALIMSDRPGPRISFVIRYLGDLTAAEGTVITDSGLALMAVSHPRGGELSADLGTTDGVNAVARAHNAALPLGIHLWLDLEAWSGEPANAIAYVDAWAANVSAAGYLPGLYVGQSSGPNLTPAQLYATAVEAYWHSISAVPDVATAGYMLVQLTPGDQILAGLEVDLDVVQRDRRGRLPIAATASP
jgi:hypothetical protein